MKTHSLQKGVGLIEALVAFLVIGIGIAAIAILQKDFLQGGSEAKARAVALSLAQEKLNDLKSFEKIAADANRFDYLDITTNQGGTFDYPGTSLRFPVYTTTTPFIPPNSNVGYSVKWAVENGSWTSGAIVYPTTKAIPDQKRVTVNVSWLDENNVRQNVSLQSIISAIPSSNSAGLMDSEGSVKGKPQVFYTPSTDPGVVAVSVGSGKSRETLVPTATSSGEVKFTAYSYNSSGLLIRQEDFLNVSCNCAFNGTGSTNNPGYAKWDSGTQTYVDQIGDAVTKDKGCQTNGNNANCLSSGSADVLCSLCCQDHHDAGSSAVDSSSNKYCDPAGVLDRCFDPFRGSQDYNTSGKHNHYTSAGALATSGQYLESCRMKMIDGFWRVYQDWHRVDLSAFPISEITLSTSEADYAGYVEDIVDAILDDNSITTFDGQSFTKPTKPLGINRTVANSNVVTLAVDEKMSLTGRGVYIDYLPQNILDQVRTKKTAGQDYLIDVPFYEVEVTDRSPECKSVTEGYGGWCAPAGTAISVGLSGSGAHALEAGEVKGNSASSAVNVTFAMRRSNSGLMGLSSPVDTNTSANNYDKTRDEVTVAVEVSGTGATTHTLAVSLTGATPTTGTLTVTPTSGSASCTGSIPSYTCTVPNNLSGTISFSGSNGSGDSCTGSGSYTASSSSQTATITITCTPVSTSHTLTVNLNATGGTPSTGTLSGSLATSCTGSGTSYTCLEPDTATGTGTLSYSGQTSSGSVCSGTGSYTATGAAQTVTLDVTCISTRTLNVCLTEDDFDSGTLTATPTGGSGITCSPPLGACGSGANQGISSICMVTSGIGGGLSFNGIRIVGSNTRTCTGTGSYTTTDASVNVDVDC